MASVSRRDDRGAVLPMVAVMVSVLVVFAAFAVDLGRQRVARRDMQALADIVALDLSREMDGRSKAVIKSADAWRDSIRDTVRRNLNTNESVDIVVDPKAVVTVADSPVRLEIEMGMLAGDGAFTSIANPEIPTAVRVVAATEVDFGFAPGSGGASRAAVAEADEFACFSLGSYAASIRSGDSELLAPLLGEALGVDVLSYQGLANADAELSLLDLALELDAGTVDGLADLPPVTLADLYLASAQVLTRDGQTAAASLLNALAADVGPLGPVDLGRVVSVDQGASAALDGAINVFDLVAATAFVANGENFVSIPSLSVDLGLASAGLTDVKLIQKPQVSCGRTGVTTAETSQVSLTFDAAVGVSIPLVASVSGEVELTVDLAKARGTLEEIECRDGTAAQPDRVELALDSTLLLPQLTLDLEVRALFGAVSIPVTLEVTPAPDVRPGTVTVPVPPSMKHAAIGTTGLSGVTVTGGGPLGSLLNPVLGAVVTPIVLAVDNLVVPQLSALVGLETAGVDAFAHGRPECALPALRG